MAEAARHDYLARVPVASDFARIADPAAYAPLPDDWMLGLADVVQSTAAIAAGQYKLVNMAGAAVIAAVSNALDQARFPFVFGGDGASFAVPPECAGAARAALAATATLVAEEFGLTLRIAEVPVRAIRDAGFDLRVLQFAASGDVAYSMFTGGGLAWAEGRMKAGDFALEPAAPGTRPDLTGLSCRFEPARTRNGLVLSMIVRPEPGRNPGSYAALVGDLLQLIDDSPDKARPLPQGGPPLNWVPAEAGLEARLLRRAGESLWRRRALVFVKTALGNLVLKLRLRVGTFDATRYLDQLVANSDYRKYDDGLRMTIDGSPELAQAIEQRLARAEAEGVARYGLHRQEAALMTCITHTPSRSDHIHFIDGASGGYAAAAAALKQ
jgi:hypothetical protein